MTDLLKSLENPRSERMKTMHEVLLELDKLEQKLEHILESDPRSIINPEHEFGSLFDNVYEALKIARKIERKLEANG